jgi:hypothetical protein
MTRRFIENKNKEIARLNGIYSNMLKNAGGWWHSLLVACLLASASRVPACVSCCCLSSLAASGREAESQESGEAERQRGREAEESACHLCATHVCPPCAAFVANASVRCERASSMLVLLEGDPLCPMLSKAVVACTLAWPCLSSRGGGVGRRCKRGTCSVSVQARRMTRVHYQSR